MDLCILNSVPCLPLELLVSMGPSPLLWFCAFKTATLAPQLQVIYGSQTSPVDLCMQNSMPTITSASHYGSQTSSVDLCKQNSLLSTRLTSFYWSQTSRVDLCKLNSVFSTRITSQYGPRSHLWFLHPKRKLQHQNCMSLWVPDLTCDFVHAKQRT